MERGLEFYVMLAAVAVGALTWLYRKGSRVWRTVRKLRRSFQEICLNPKSTLADEPCRQLAIGAMYASQQGAWQNSLETGIDDTLPEILGNWWGIDSTAEAREQLDYLCEKGFRYYWPTVLEAFRLDGRERQDELLQQRMTSQEDYDKASSQLENLRETFDELLSCGVVASKEELSGCNVTGWDAGRIVFLARACCEMGYLTEEEAWAYIGRADALAHEACGSWRELAMSYILGRSLWGGTGLQFGDEDDGRRAAEQPQEPVGALPVVRADETAMKAALKYPVFYLAPAEHMVYVFWREENVTTRRLLAEADGWAGQEVVDASGRCYTIRCCWETGPVGLYGRIGPTDRRTVRYDTDFEEAVRDCMLPKLQAWIAREYPRSEWFRETCWHNAADFRQAVFRCRSFEELARMFRCRPEEEPSIRRSLVRFFVVPLVVGVVIWLLARYT